MKTITAIPILKQKTLQNIDNDDVVVLIILI